MTNRSNDSIPDRDLVRSPGGWEPPEGAVPGWEWVPPCGATPRPDLMPLWVRTIYKVPLIDRVAHQVMWQRGGFLVLPPSHEWFRRHRSSADD